MPNFRLKRSTQAQADAYLGAPGELVIDTTNKSLRVHDGSYTGGTRQAVLNSAGQISFSQMPDPVIATPTAVAPTNGATGQSTSGLVLQTSGFAMSSGLSQSHAYTQWQVATDSGFSSLVVNTGDVTSLLSYTLAVSLAINTTYYWRARHKSASGVYSLFSAATAFTTTNAYASDEVFSAYTYKGTNAASSINNGINLSGNGGLVWTKVRTTNYNNYLYDTARGVGNYLETNTTSGNSAFANGLTAFNSNGYSLGDASGFNSSVNDYVSWTFRKAAKFFDIVTYTGNSGTQNIAHSLGITPGMIIVKCTNTVGSWVVWHNQFAATEYMALESTNAKSTGNSAVWNATLPTSTSFSVGATSLTNFATTTYVAYLFAHDVAAAGLIQCGSFTTDGSGNATITLGWEPQYVIRKRVDVADGWNIVDSMRGFAADNGLYNGDAYLQASGSGVENFSTLLDPTATGFKSTSASASATYIYVAIRRSNKTPTIGTQVFNAVARTGNAITNTLVSGVGFAPDLAIIRNRTAAGQDTCAIDRLRGMPAIYFTDQPIAQSSNVTIGATNTFTSMDGIYVGDNTAVNGASASMINWFFKRAPGVFDIVAKNLVGGLFSTNHALGVTPELVIMKPNSATNWIVWHPSFPANNALVLSTQALVNLGSPATASSTSFSVNGWMGGDVSMVAYFFATKAGISKVGTYTGDGTTSGKVIECGFTGGARFILIKRTDAVGDWYVWDTIRGIGGGSELSLSLNTTAVEVASNSINQYAGGFGVQQNATTNINVTSANYIYLAFA